MRAMDLYVADLLKSLVLYPRPLWPDLPPGPPGGVKTITALDGYARGCQDDPSTTAQQIDRQSLALPRK